MNLLRLSLIFFLSLAISNAQAPSASHNRSGTTAPQNAQAELQLMTSIVKQRYCSDAGLTTLRWTLNLTYTNAGSQPILLDKKSSLIYRLMVGRSLKALSAGKYEYETRSLFISPADLHNAGIRDNAPEEDAFVILKPSESYNLETDYWVELYDGTKDTEDFLRPGNHFLQVRVATWYYFASPEIYREQWRAKGYLWSKNITSVPMPFRVEETRAVPKCF